MIASHPMCPFIIFLYAHHNSLLLTCCLLFITRREGIDTSISHLSVGDKSIYAENLFHGNDRSQTVMLVGYALFIENFPEGLHFFSYAQEQLLGQARRMQGYKKQQDSPFKANYNKLATLIDTNSMLSALFASNDVFKSTLLLLLGV
jgi:hypothetical protein